MKKYLPEFIVSIKYPAASNGVSNLQRYRAAGYLTLAAVAKCLQAATWLVARGNKENFTAQIIVTRQLAPEDNLYLYCLTNNLSATNLIQKLTDDYTLHQEQAIYVQYMHQLTTANIKTEGGSPMICEGLLNLCGTSSKEIIERTKEEEADYYLPQIDYLKSLLEQNNIPFTLDEKLR